MTYTPRAPLSLSLSLPLSPFSLVCLWHCSNFGDIASWPLPVRLRSSVSVRPSVRPSVTGTAQQSDATQLSAALQDCAPSPHHASLFASTSASKKRTINVITEINKYKKTRVYDPKNRDSKSKPTELAARHQQLCGRAPADACLYSVSRRHQCLKFKLHVF